MSTAGRAQGDLKRDMTSMSSTVEITAGASFMAGSHCSSCSQVCGLSTFTPVNNQPSNQLSKQLPNQLSIQLSAQLSNQLSKATTAGAYMASTEPHSGLKLQEQDSSGAGRQPLQLQLGCWTTSKLQVNRKSEPIMSKSQMTGPNLGCL